MSDVIESHTQLRMLLDDNEVAGKTLRGFVAPRFGASGADLDSVTFERVGMAEADLTNVRLEHATLKSVDLTRAMFEGSLLHRVKAYDNTQVRGADLRGVEIRRCDLGPNLWMESCNFTGAKIQATNFSAVDLQRAVFKNAVLLRCNFHDYVNSVASLNKVSFVEAVLIEVDLKEVSMQNADLSRALLIRCDLRGANLTGAVMTGTRLIDCRTDGADLSETKV
jgi:uncharacterized protein YjbI with pentapeptide repeats